MGTIKGLVVAAVFPVDLFKSGAANSAHSASKGSRDVVIIPVRVVIVLGISAEPSEWARAWRSGARRGGIGTWGTSDGNGIDEINPEVDDCWAADTSPVTVPSHCSALGNSEIPLVVALLVLTTDCV